MEGTRHRKPVDGAAQGQETRVAGEQAGEELETRAGPGGWASGESGVLGKGWCFSSKGWALGWGWG